MALEKPKVGDSIRLYDEKQTYEINETSNSIGQSVDYIVDWGPEYEVTKQKKFQYARLHNATVGADGQWTVTLPFEIVSLNYANIVLGWGFFRGGIPYGVEFSGKTITFRLLDPTGDNNIPQGTSVDGYILVIGRTNI